MRQPVYYKTRQFYHKIRQVLQNVSILLQNAAGIRKRVIYYKTGHNAGWVGSQEIQEHCSFAFDQN